MLTSVSGTLFKLFKW